MNESIPEAEGVRKVCRVGVSEVVALHDLGLQLSTEEIVAVMGPSQVGARLRYDGRQGHNRRVRVWAMRPVRDEFQPDDDVDETR